jgi:ABC-type phosphate/phosphonate transport system substrate-binding protein
MSGALPGIRNLELREAANPPFSINMPMKKTSLFLALLLPLVTFGRMPEARAEKASPKTVRIGVDIRVGFQSCIDYWMPVTDYLSKAIPEYRFVIVPLASHQDLTRTLDKGGVDFLALDPALELMAEDLYGAMPLATMMETGREETNPCPPNAACRSAVIRRADRAEIQSLRNLRGLQLSAVKPWSLTGWIAQWGLLVKNGIDPDRSLKQVIFEGTHAQAIESVLNGSADAGVVDADLLFFMAKNKRIAPDSLDVFNRQGRAVPLVAAEFVDSTEAHPGRVFAKAADVSDDLANRVTDALLKSKLNTTLDGMPCQIRWSAPCNSSKVRHLLQTLMGPDFAESSGFPLPPRRPAWLFPLQISGIALGMAFLAIALVKHSYQRRRVLMEEQLQETRTELIEVRADMQRINAILALAGCGIDIVDDENQIVYADSSLQQRFGDWHGRKCHEYFCDSEVPCPECQRPFPINEQCRTALDVDCTEWAPRARADAKIRMIEGETTRMIGVPFHDEGGRWLFARIHFPLTAFAETREQPVSL